MHKMFTSSTIITQSLRNPKKNTAIFVDHAILTVVFIFSNVACEISPLLEILPPSKCLCTLLPTQNVTSLYRIDSYICTCIISEQKCVHCGCRFLQTLRWKSSRPRTDTASIRNKSRCSESSRKYSENIKASNFLTFVIIYSPAKFISLS